MSNTSIQIKKSGQTGNTPSSLAYGEIAINYADGKLYYKNSSNTISFIENQDTFSTINVGGSLILATSPTDTISFVSGNNVSLQADTLNNKITISTSGTDDYLAREWANSAGSYANSAFSKANSAYNYANTLTLNGISNGTSNIAISSLNGNITAAVAGNNVVTISANGITTTGIGTGDITGANNILANTFIGINSALISGVNVVPYFQGAYNTANSAGSYANSAFAVANTDVTNVSVTPGQYGNTTTIPVITIAANGRITSVSNATVSGGGTATGSYISNGTSNLYFAAANSSIIANVAGNTVVTISANGITTTGIGTGDIIGANNIYANTFIAANGIVVSGLNVVPYIQNAYDQANTDVTNVSITSGQYGNTTTIPVITIAANGRITAISNATVSGGGGGSGAYISSGTSNVYFESANGNIVANVSGNTIVTITANGITTSGVSGDISGANTIYANNIITTGTGGTITGANNIYSNTFIAANGVVVAGLNVVPYIQNAYNQANTDVTNVSVTAGQYGNTTTIPVITIAANGRITAVSNATVSGGGGTASGSYISNGTSNLYFTSANGSIVANVAGNTVVTITSNGIVTSGVSGDISGANTIYANNIITTGTGGTITGANNIYSNNFIATTGIVVAGLNVVPYLQSSFAHANAAFVKANTGIANTANTANTANSANIANTSVYARVTNVTTGVYYPIITDTTITGQDTLHYSSNDFLMYAANNTFRASGNVWAGQFITVGSNVPVINSTGHWVGQTITAVIDASARSTSNSAALYANGAFTQANASFTQSNAAFDKANTAITTSGGTITGSLNVSANVVIGGNLIVLGTESIVNTTTLKIDDSLIYIAGNNYFSDAVDIGIIGHYNDGANAHTGIFRDANLKEWIFFKGYTPEVQSNNLINIADPSFAYANVWADYFKGNVIANTVTVSGNTTISGVTNLGPVANVRITGGTNGYVLSTDGAGNLSWVVQSGGGGGSGTDQYARDTANAAFTQANAAFAVANTGGGGGGSGSSIIATDTFTANGTGNTFTLSYSTTANNVIVNIDGVLQLKSAYNVSDTTLTLSGTPANNAIVEVTTLTGTNLSYYNRTYTGDNTTVSFATTSGVSNVSLIVTENGVVQEPGVDYYISGANVVFTTAPSTGVKIGVRELASTAVVDVDISPAFNQANSAFAQANAAFNQANSASSGVTTGKAIAMAIVFGG